MVFKTKSTLKKLLSLLTVLSAGVIAGITSLFLYHLYLKLPPEIEFFISVSSGISIAFIVESILKRERLKKVVLRRVIPGLIGISIATILIFNYPR